MNLKDFAERVHIYDPLRVQSSPSALIIDYADPDDERDIPPTRFVLSMSLDYRDGRRLGDPDLVEVNDARQVVHHFDTDNDAVLDYLDDCAASLNRRWNLKNEEN